MPDKKLANKKAATHVAAFTCQCNLRLTNDDDHVHHNVYHGRDGRQMSR